MPVLFSYGTLQDEQVQLSLFGRTLVGHPDALIGYEQALARVADPKFARASGKSHHAILRRANSANSAAAKVEGTAFEVTDAELERADRYEPVEYQRVMATLASGGAGAVHPPSRARASRARATQDRARIWTGSSTARTPMGAAFYVRGCAAPRRCWASGRGNCCAP